MKYTIISLNDERLVYKQAIRAQTKFEEVGLPAIDGRQVDIKHNYMMRGLWQYEWKPKLGEAGVWLSNFDRWKLVSKMNEPLIVFEDDAIITPEFDDKIYELLEYMPDDWDYCTLWVPENQKQDYYYNVIFNHIGDPYRIGPNRRDEDSLFRFNDKVSFAYQGYGMVSLMYSPQGGQKLTTLAQRTGICTPVDCWIYQQTHIGKLKGFAPHPLNEIVRYDWQAQTTVHNSDKAWF